ncbi:YitT family protein [Alkalihalobacillus sp. LMS6]|uniref:YitT family protein n=1 Tax=Alkalihalobacillus sp. LMS6 TaxID=2924034 RepID=UPI0020D088DA|nr:YitT family protein [Alkalihalobacillus sp. LMS6]UTR05281.1 YitT family protein [Alkalihalobacillus sp. LMS6]
MNFIKKMASILAGCFIVAIGVLLLRHAGLVTGGTAGLTLTLSYLISLPFSLLFFLVNIPFYIFSFMRMGLSFTIITALSVTLLSLLTAVDTFLPSFTVPMFAGAVFGGLSIGLGLTLLFKNQASLGGANILALFLQKKAGIDPGKTNFLFDATVVLLSFLVIGVIPGLLSILSIVITSKVISLFKNSFVKNEKTVKVKKPAVARA